MENEELPNFNDAKNGGLELARGFIIDFGGGGY